MNNKPTNFNFISSELTECKICPRNCKVNRINRELGYCKTDAGFNISSICIHKGEEPAIGGNLGVCNIFFSHCNLQCIYCQNHQISCNDIFTNNSISLETILSQILKILNTGINVVGFVSPSHVAPQVKEIITAIRNSGYNPKFVWNSNGYDKPETLRSLETFIDIYLPDFKYIDEVDSKQFSDANNYPEVAIKAIKEMYFQKGSKLITDENGIAESGLIIRHLVLPGKADSSIKLLNTIAEEISTRVTISLMAQYFPTDNVKNHPILKKQITEEEYKKVTEAMYKLGFNNGWIQEYESHLNYRPDFEKENPFEN
ncbi:MAG: 4Fe-4S cluster-binding domain-containing protein [Bacteroidia bacterium]|nr:4Fe-4S cluster-binding domain-containing protein [Bacteroidia bacterium]